MLCWSDNIDQTYSLNLHETNGFTTIVHILQQFQYKNSFWKSLHTTLTFNNYNAKETVHGCLHCLPFTQKVASPNTVGPERVSIVKCTDNSSQHKNFSLVLAMLCSADFPMITIPLSLPRILCAKKLTNFYPHLQSEHFSSSLSSSGSRTSASHSTSNA